jgi:hypothetical protein
VQAIRQRWQSDDDSKKREEGVNKMLKYTKCGKTQMYIENGIWITISRIYGEFRWTVETLENGVFAHGMEMSIRQAKEKAEERMRERQKRA